MEIAAADLARILDLYSQGLYLRAFHQAEALAPLRNWTGTAARLLAGKCVAGIAPDRKRCNELVEQSLAMITPLAVKIGYDRAAALAHEAFHSGETIRNLLKNRGILSDNEIERILDPKTMI